MTRRNLYAGPGLLLLVLGLVSLAGPTRLEAGAWTQPKRAAYIKLAALSFASNEDLNAGGNRVGKPGMGELTDFSISAYLEYGLHERLTLVASLPYKRLLDERRFTDEEGTLTGIGRERHRGPGDLDLRLRWRWRTEPAVISLALGGKVPLDYKMRLDSNVPLGTGELDGDIRLLVGKSLHPFPGYLTGTAGYRKRGGEFGDELFFGLEGGITWKRLLFKGAVEGIGTLGDCGATGQAGLTGDQDIIKVAPGLIWPLTQNLELGLDLFHPVAGCNTALGTTYALGLAFKH
ncbi:MAG: hypothetical protein GKR89_05070 [Candidatus Latescibacteria bacterium]|nr:hypothetical protein [Candidatus Latescibacterota bacterium]